MTIILSLKTTKAALEGVLADFKTMGMETKVGQERDMFNAFVEKTEWMLSGLKNRIDEIQDEEPQYREEK